MNVADIPYASTICQRQPILYMRHLQPFLVLLLIAACTQISARESTNGSNRTDDVGHGIRLADDEVERIASALGQR